MKKKKKKKITSVSEVIKNPLHLFLGCHFFSGVRTQSCGIQPLETRATTHDTSTFIF